MRVLSSILLAVTLLMAFEMTWSLDDASRSLRGASNDFEEDRELSQGNTVRLHVLSCQCSHCIRQLSPLLHSFRSFIRSFVSLVRSHTQTYVIDGNETATNVTHVHTHKHKHKTTIVTSTNGKKTTKIVKNKKSSPTKTTSKKTTKSKKGKSPK